MSSWESFFSRHEKQVKKSLFVCCRLAKHKEKAKVISFTFSEINQRRERKKKRRIFFISVYNRSLEQLFETECFSLSSSSSKDWVSISFFLLNLGNPSQWNVRTSTSKSRTTTTENVMLATSSKTCASLRSTSFAYYFTYHAQKEKKNWNMSRIVRVIHICNVPHTKKELAATYAII